ncbi:MAG: hypothetical protein PF630_05630 [Gammaproteobacteria bacterium]|jgi:hypothetical protein|nr:hypothetical protein [Gammaproteobacteria bacterium]
MNIIQSVDKIVAKSAVSIFVFMLAQLAYADIDSHYDDAVVCGDCSLVKLAIQADIENGKLLAIDRINGVWQGFDIVTVVDNGQVMTGNKTVTAIPTPTEFVPDIENVVLFA